MSLINKDKPNFNKKYILKWIILIVIIGVISGIGYVKKNSLNNNQLADNSNSKTKSESKNVSENKEQSSKNTSKFALDATNNFNLEQLKTYGQPMAIDFGSDSCIPCKEMKPVLETLNKELKDKVVVKFVDVSKNPDAADNLPLKVIPTQFFLR